MSAQNILHRLPVISGVPHFFPGAYGDALTKMGVPPNACAALDYPAQLRRLTDDYIGAGANQLVVANTFPLSSHRMRGDFKRVAAAIHAAYPIPKSIIEPITSDFVLLGSVAPARDCYDAGATPDEETLYCEHTDTVAIHKAAGVECLLFETLPTIIEAMVMGDVAAQLALPFILSFTLKEDGNLPDSHSIIEAERATRSPWRVGIGVNCCSIEGAKQAVQQLRTVVSGEHIVAYPNAFRSTREQFGDCSQFCDHKQAENVFTPKEYAEHMVELVRLGATIIGVCCGGDPRYTRAYVNAFR